MAKQLRKLPKLTKCFRKINRKAKASIILLTIVASTTGMAKASELLYTNVRVYDNGGSILYDTPADTVRELFENENITIGELDFVNYDLNSPIEPNMLIKIERAFNVNIVINDEEPFSVLTREKTVGEIIANLKKERNCDFVLLGIGQSSFTKAEPNMTIKLNSVKEEFSSRTEEIVFQTKTVENPNIYEGTENVVSEGQNGEKTIKTKTTYVSGKQKSSEDIEEIITKEPIDRVIEIGTKVKPPVIQTEKGTFEIDKELYVTTTAYTASTACTGKLPGDPGFGITASGMRASVGVVAVDPSFIPLGTKLYIEGYGYAVAGDTGSAIKNNKIDLYFNSNSECISYGIKRNVKVYVLGNAAQ